MDDLDIKDLKILFELDKDSRQSLTGIAKKVRLSKEVVFHRINKLIGKGYISRFQAVISVCRIGYQPYKIYLKLQDMTRESRREIQDYLLKRKEVYWIGNCQGKWDLILAVWARSVQEFSSIHDEILGKLGKNILDKEISSSHRTMQFNRRWFYSDNSKTVETTFGEDLEKASIDDADTHIIGELSKNSRIKIVDLSEKLKISPQSLIYKMRQMEKKGIIAGYKISLDPKKMGYETCKAFISLKNLTEKRKQELLSHCRFLKNAINVVMTAARWDLEIEFEVKDFEQYYNIMESLKEDFSDIIKSYESVIIVSEPKQIFMPGI